MRWRRMASLAEPAHESTDAAERERIQRAARGDDAAVEELLAAHLDGLRGYVRLRMGRVLRTREESADLVQSVCREVLSDLDGFEYRGNAAFRDWLFTCAEHKLRDRARFWARDRRDAAREQPLAGFDDDELATLDGLSSLLSPSRDAVAAEELARLESAFAKLEPDYREVILLARVVGLSHAEIAARMGRTESATWNLLSRALAKLSTLLERG
ncbi:MAG: sigma-70 family RNA polymerase sigma factor [Planctomycetota bacterium]|nr:MAG: sigma-70 family RNA polymerase sigma factor [Planctomycetota bacterium]